MLGLMQVGQALTYFQATVPWTCQQCTTDMNRKKKRQYSQRVKEVEHGMGSLDHWFLVQQEEWLVSVQHFTGVNLADMISIKQDKPYSLVVSWLRTRLSYVPFMLLFCAFVEAGHHIATLFTNMILPLPLLRVRYHPQFKNLLVTLFFLMHCFV